MHSATESTTSEKAVVCGAAFASACFAFAVSAVILIPVTGTAMNALAVPGIFQQAVILSELFAVPIVAAFVGLSIGMQFITKRSNTVS